MVKTFCGFPLHTGNTPCHIPLSPPSIVGPQSLL